MTTTGCPRSVARREARRTGQWFTEQNPGSAALSACFGGRRGSGSTLESAFGGLVAAGGSAGWTYGEAREAPCGDPHSVRPFPGPGGSEVYAIVNLFLISHFFPHSK